MTYYELSPAYGRDYKTKAEVTHAWQTGADFQGGYQLGFQVVNIEDIPKPCTVNLRYKGLRNITVVKVPIGAQTREPKPKAYKQPSLQTMQRWIFDGVAQATDGCEVEPDGHCEHGCKSWLLELEVI